MAGSDELEPTNQRERSADAHVAAHSRTRLVYRGRDSSRIIFPLTGDTDVFVGNDPQCTICIAWDEYVSRTNFVLRPIGGRWQIEDLGSTNGTRVNGRKVRRWNLEP